MSVYIEIFTTPQAMQTLTIPEVAALCDLRYGISDGSYVLAQGETGKYNILFSAPIGRGVEVSLEARKVGIVLPLPNTPHDIALCYRLVEKLCAHLQVDSFVRDGETIPAAEAPFLVPIELQASLNAIRNMEQELRDGKQQTFSVFGALNPIVLDLREFDAIGGTLDGYEILLDHLQQLDAWYAVARFFRLEGEDGTGPVVGMFFIGEDTSVVLPLDPAPAYQQVEGVDGYYVRIPGESDIPYAEFLSHVEQEQRYDAAHVVVRLSGETIRHLAQHHAVNMVTRKPQPREYAPGE